jgi:hypothetical protein
MAKWLLLNVVPQPGGRRTLHVGEVIDDAFVSLAPIQAAGGVLLPATLPTLAAFAAIANANEVRRGQALDPALTWGIALAGAIKAFNVSPAIAIYQKAAADGAAGTPTAETPIASVQNPGVAVFGQFVPNAALTGDPSNNATLSILKRTAGGAPVTVATLTTTASWAQWVPQTIPAVGGAASSLAAGDAISLTITKNGTGVVVPAGCLNLFPG